MEQPHADQLRLHFTEGSGTAKDPYIMPYADTIDTTLGLLGKFCEGEDQLWFSFRGYSFAVDRDFNITYTAPTDGDPQEFTSVLSTVRDAERRIKDQKYGLANDQFAAEPTKQQPEGWRARTSRFLRYLTQYRK